jgi:hypothetical protein
MKASLGRVGSRADADAAPTARPSSKVGLFERQGQVYTEIVPDCSKLTLQGIIRGRVDPRTVINPNP